MNGIRPFRNDGFKWTYVIIVESEGEDVVQKVSCSVNPSEPVTELQGAVRTIRS